MNKVMDYETAQAAVLRQAKQAPPADVVAAGYIFLSALATLLIGMIVLVSLI